MKGGSFLVFREGWGVVPPSSCNSKQFYTVKYKIIKKTHRNFPKIITFSLPLTMSLGPPLIKIQLFQ